ncbi:MAG: hypothetical protein KJ714_09975 [Euryarchaeota archaeon]|nr:hypothetical protein [Euryarchaeota archaeon]
MISKFVREAGTAGVIPAATPAPAYAGIPKEPGFEILAAISALLVVFTLRRRL